MRLLERLVRGATRTPIHRDVRRRLTFLQGAEHVPPTGAFVLAPNHSSYYDHFAVETILWALRGTPTWFLTKKESFVAPLKRFWHEVWYSIPVDRENPGPSTARDVRAVLRGGGALCVYPEGTRGAGDALLPFQAGAFRFALAARVPVIPVALVGTREILPRGARVPGSGSVRVAFGPPLEVPRDLGKVEAAEHLSVACRRELERLLAQARAAGADGAPASAAGLAGLVSARLDDAIAETRTVGRATLARACAVLALARDLDPASGAVAAQRARVTGLRARQARGPRRLVGVIRTRLAGERVLRSHPDEPMANYLLGRWHLAAPPALGAAPAAAVRHLTRASAVWPAGDVRALLALADALDVVGYAEGVRDVLERAVRTGDPTLPGAARRLERARARLAALPSRASARPGRPAPGERRPGETGVRALTAQQVLR